MIVFYIIGLVAFTAAPTVSDWVAEAGSGGGGLTRNLTSGGSRLAGLAGARAGAVAGRTVTAGATVVASGAKKACNFLKPKKQSTMDFKNLRNIENSFRRVRLYTVIFALLCMGVALSFLVSIYSFANKQREKIYVLDRGKLLILALAQDVEVNRPVETREHPRRFHKLFFTLAPGS